MATPSSPQTENKDPKVESPASPPLSTPSSPAPTSPVPAAAPATAAPASASETPAETTVNPPAAATSASPPPAGAPAASATPTPHPNPKVAALLSMFPTVDTGVIEMVLESVGGSQDRAIESLLQMTDPEFKPDSSATQTEETNSQLNMDEEFARALHIQEQEEMRAEPRSTRRGSTGGSEFVPPAQLPYQPRVRRPRPAQPDPYASSTREHDLDSRYAEPPAGHGPGGDAPGMIAFEEKLGQFAEVGKQTFNRFFNTAKAKYAEMQEGHESRKTAQQEVAAEWREQGAAEGPMVGAHERKKYGGLWGTEPVSTPPRPRWSPSDAYDEQRPSSTSPGRRSPIGLGSGATSPSQVASPGKIDLSKLGFLPKKKVDLMSTGADRDPNPQLKSPLSPPKSPTRSTKSPLDQIPKTPPAELSPHTLGDSDDDDDLDYTQNPFDRK